jgi:ribosomal protein S18 acetylase RimI-like enzyme
VTLVRVAGAGDAVALAGLIAAFRDHLRAERPGDAEIEAHLPAALADPGIEFACAWVAGEPVGYTQTRLLRSVWAPGLEAHLEDLFVVASARRRRIGRSLLRHAVTRAAARGAARLSLTTNERNEAAQSLYRAEGFSVQSHALYPGGREVLWVRALAGA